MVKTAARLRYIFPFLLLALLSVQAPMSRAFDQPWAYWLGSNEASTRQPDHSRWQQLLDRYLHRDAKGQHLFAYGAVSGADKASLKAYLDTLEQVDPRTLSRAEQRAYWINLYNAATVKLVLDHYPVSSIRRIHRGLLPLGPWDDELITVAGKRLSLNDIEHRILRAIWRDRRIHYALNCASMGCPPLQAEAFTAQNADALLQAAEQAFIRHPRGVRYDNGRLVVSKIFRWFSEDFASSEQGLRRYLAQFAAPEEQAALLNGKVALSYQYDWSLNDYVPR